MLDTRRIFCGAGTPIPAATCDKFGLKCYGNDSNKEVRRYEQSARFTGSIGESGLNNFLLVY